MLLQDGTSQNFFPEPITADELFGGLTPRHRQDLGSIEKHIQVLPDNTVFASGDCNPAPKRPQEQAFDFAGWFINVIHNGAWHRQKDRTTLEFVA